MLLTFVRFILLRTLRCLPWIQSLHCAIVITKCAFVNAMYIQVFSASHFTLVTTGQDGHIKLRQLLYASTDIFLLCCPCDDANALINLERRWYEEIRKANHSKTPMILVLTKCDRRKDSGIDRNALLNVVKIARVASKLKVADFFECSAKTGENVEVLFKRAAELVIRRQNYDKRSCIIL
ncbi:hypothetical protein FBUS_03289 [Fasciolopsis buskii]|uniref:Rho GTPase n=1 Tax=Fasciolopsis buskii TaxID=27845 RepID=A0A8E0RR43_9TREM|nr:hypothetical protein FBUS_03289 [Fasciolopsis buski]